MTTSTPLAQTWCSFTWGPTANKKTTLGIPLEDDPGEVYSYSNFNSQLLSLVLERATGESFAAYLSTRLWQPLQKL